MYLSPKTNDNNKYTLSLGCLAKDKYDADIKVVKR